MRTQDSNRSRSKPQGVARKRRKQHLPKIDMCKKQGWSNIATACIRPSGNKNGDICDHANAPHIGMQRRLAAESNHAGSATPQQCPTILKASHDVNPQQGDSNSLLTDGNGRSIAGKRLLRSTQPAFTTRDALANNLDRAIQRVGHKGELDKEV